MPAFASAVAMVRPSSFQFNSETAITNHFQTHTSRNAREIQQAAVKQFDAMVEMLEQNGISVLILTDTPELSLPDAIFPNNWFVSLPNQLLLCPMHAASRRRERRKSHIDEIVKYTGAAEIIDWSSEENDSRFLEGTGVLILDHTNKKAFACRSERIDEKLFRKFCSHFGFEGFLFDATDRSGKAIYHTNVMMCLGNNFALICEEALVNSGERDQLRDIITASGREIISLSISQLENFAGNMLQLINSSGEHFLVMSSTAFNSLSAHQVELIETYTSILKADVDTIESVGGGSARCMMAELFPL